MYYPNLLISKFDTKIDLDLGCQSLMKINISLSALRSFVAAVETQNFSKAAKELGVTQSAISQHVSLLEQHLGVSLFIREGRRIRPAIEARTLARSIKHHLEGLNEVLMSAKIKQETILVISAPPGFAIKWLFPRLGSFNTIHPNIELTLISERQVSELTEGDADFSIEYLRRRQSLNNSTQLIEEDMFPVCSPDYLRESPSLNLPQDLENHTLIFDFTQTIDNIAPNWAAWKKKAGIANLEPRHKLKFGQADMVIQAALAGKGIALGRTALVADDLQNGNLIIPIGPIIPSRFAYYLTNLKTPTESTKNKSFKQWISREARLCRPKLVIQK
ncbi:MAG: LysR family glycine cleavage system transcriptional activator [Flavobacterium sp.]